MIKQELDLIWIASDGKRFLDKNKAIKHEKKCQEEKNLVEHINDKWNTEF